MSIRQFKDTIMNTTTLINLFHSRGVLRTPTAYTLVSLRKHGYTVTGVLERAAHDHPDRLAVVDDEGPITYEELNQRARECASWLLAKGIGCGDGVGILMRNSRHVIEVLAATGHIGARPVIINPMSGPQQVAGIAGEYGLRILIHDDEFNDDTMSLTTSVGKVLSATSGVWYDYPGRSYLTHYGSRATPQPTVIMSSGSRGVPKGIVMPVNKAEGAAASLDKVPWREGLIIGLHASMFHAWGWSGMVFSLATASTIITHRHFSAEESARDVSFYPITALFSSGVFLRELAGRLGGTHVRGRVEFILTAGNAMPESLTRKLIDMFGPVVYNTYGSTENATITVATGKETAQYPTTVGRAPYGVEMKVIRGDGSRCYPGEVGRIVSSQAMTMVRALDDADDTDRVDGLLPSGDVGYVNEEGLLFITGRDDDMVIRGGENIHPASIANVVANMPGVKDAYVMAKSIGLDALITAYVVPSSLEVDGDADAVRKYVEFSLSSSHVPDVIVWRDDLPYNAGGKVDEKALLADEA